MSRGIVLSRRSVMGEEFSLVYVGSLQDGDSHLQAFDELLQVFIGPQDFQRVRHLSLLAHLVQFLARAGKLAAFSSATISSPRPTSRTRWRDYRTPKRPQKSARGAIAVTF